MHGEIENLETCVGGGGVLVVLQSRMAAFSPRKDPMSFSETQKCFPHPKNFQRYGIL